MVSLLSLTNNGHINHQLHCFWRILRLVVLKSGIVRERAAKNNYSDLHVVLLVLEVVAGREKNLLFEKVDAGDLVVMGCSTC